MDNIVIIIVQCFEELYMHQRSDDKRTFPGLYGLGAGGKVEPNEDVSSAAKRELKEELGLESQAIRLFDFIFRKGNYRINVYRTILDEKKKINYDTKEFQWGGWMKIEEIDRNLATKALLCPDTKAAYEHFKKDYLK